MALVENTNDRHRLRLPVVAIVLTTLATAMAGLRHRPSRALSGFLLDRGRYIAFDAPEAVEPCPRHQRSGRSWADTTTPARAGFLRDKAAGSPTSSPRRSRSGPSTSTTGARSWASTARTPAREGRGRRHGFLLARGKITRIDVPGAVSTWPTASTTAVRWWAHTSTLTASSTAISGIRVGSPSSTCPASSRQSATSTIVVRSSVSVAMIPTIRPERPGARISAQPWRFHDVRRTRRPVHPADRHQRSRADRRLDCQRSH